MQVFFVSLLLVGVLLVEVTAIGWSAWHADTTAAQGVVLSAIFFAVLIERSNRVSRPGLWQAGFYFLSGAGIGLLAYHGEISLLLGGMWIVLWFWFERQIRDDVAAFVEETLGDESLGEGMRERRNASDVPPKDVA